MIVTNPATRRLRTMNIQFPLPLDASRQSGFTTPLRLLLATTAAFWMGTAQSHGVTTTVPRQVTELRFRDFFHTPVGPTGLEISDTLRQADGQTVRLVGYMVQQENPAPGRFLLTSNPVQMSEYAHSDENDLPPATVVVYLDPSQQDWAVPHVSGLVTVSGSLSINRHEERDGRVSWVRLQLDPEAARSMKALELTGYLHRLQHPSAARIATSRSGVKNGKGYMENRPGQRHPAGMIGSEAVSTPA